MRWDLDPATIASEAEGVIAHSKAALDAVAATVAAPTYEATIVPLMTLDRCVRMVVVVVCVGGGGGGLIAVGRRHVHTVGRACE
jgi:hypothetical protein